MYDSYYFTFVVSYCSNAYIFIWHLAREDKYWQEARPDATE